MKNNISYFFITILFGIVFSNISIAEEQFKFNITEIEIAEDGNLIIGSKKGKAETYDGYEIVAENFVYNKSKNILNVSGNVEFKDKNNNLTIFADRGTYLKNDEVVFSTGNSKAITKNNIIKSSKFKFDIINNILVAENNVEYFSKTDGFTIFSDKATYQKNDELIFTEGNSKAINEDITITSSKFKFDRIKNNLSAEDNVKYVNKIDKLIIFSDKATYQKNDELIFTEGNSKAINENNSILASEFEFDKRENILIANGNVEFIDKDKDTRIYSEKATYLTNKDIIFTEGISSAVTEKKHRFSSKDVTYKKGKQEISSNNKSTIIDNNGNKYTANGFLYNINHEILKAKDVNLISKVNEEKRDNYYFSEAFFNLKENSFVSKDTKIKVHKDIFGNKDQDPRLYGSSAYGNNDVTVVNKGIFTSCKLNDDCPPWSIQSEKITHDKIKKDLIYKNAILKVYDVPILYFPKFFHPDPTVKRRTGFLQPQFNRSKTLGSSIYIPYFKTLGFDKDYTFKPTIFEDKLIFQNEFRKKTKNSNLIADFAITSGYKSSADNKKKNINHLFVDYKKDLNLERFNKSSLDLKIERVNNDTYLKVFQNNLFPSPVMPSDKNLMITKLDYDFNHENYNLSTGFQVYEKLGVKHSDRHQFVLPKYDFTKNLNFKNMNGALNFYSSGSNNLKNTNNLRSSVINDLEYNSRNYFTESGFKNNFNLYFKNLNSVGKNDPTYKSTPRVEGMGIFEISSSFPLIKDNNLIKETLTPKISFRANPGNNMKNNNSANKAISADNIFDINRLALNDTFEAGKSFTLGFDYKLDLKNKNNNKNKFLEFKLATVVRDKIENEIPTSSTINKKNSNIFGSINSTLLDNVNLNYDFSVENDLTTFESHAINSEISINNFITEFNFIEQRNEIGSNHILSNKTTYKLDEKNSFSFTTRRNKEISLTEYYDFSYQYKNDCLTAGIKYNKTFYQDNDLKPSENLFFTISLIPLTTYERTIYDN